MREVDLGMYHSESDLAFTFMHLPDALFLGNRIEPMTLALLAPGDLVPKTALSSSLTFNKFPFEFSCMEKSIVFSFCFSWKK